MDLPSVGTQERALGTTALRVSSVTYGAMGFGSSDGDEGQRRALMEAAVDAGITAIDTAPLYGFGGSERLIGRALGAMRSRPRVLTKVCLLYTSPSPRD